MAHIPARHGLHHAILEMYDKRAPTYDSEPDGFHLRLANDMVKWAIPKIPRELKSPAKVLDLCCGTGMVSMAALRELGPDTVIHGVDISAPSLKIAREKAAKAGSSKMEFIEASATELDILPLEKSSYSLITCCSALVLLPNDDLAGVLRIWATYLKPGGVLIFDVPAFETQFISSTMAAMVAEQNVPSLEYRWVKSEESVSELIRAAGMLNVSTFMTGTYKDNKYNVEDIEGIWERNTKFPIFNTQALTPTQHEEAKRSFLGAMKNLAGDDGVVRDAYKLYVAIGAKPT